MSLVAWYPLTGNLKDNIRGTTATATNATVSTTGKIGQCYTFNGNGYISFTNPIAQGSSFSIAFWAKITSTANQCFGCTRTEVGNGLSILFLNGNSMRFDTGSSYQWTISYAPPTNTWVHIAVTKDNNYKRFYVNGVLYASTTSVGNMATLSNIFTIGASHSNGSSFGNYLYGSVNDYRIYDHALSEKEVKEIAKAKILHYKFDDFQEPTSNILDFNVHKRCWSSNSSDACSFVTYTGRHSFTVKGTCSVPGAYAYIYPYYNSEPGSHHTLSAKVRNNNIKTLRVDLRIRDGSNGADLSNNMTFNIPPGGTQHLKVSTHTTNSNNIVTPAFSVYSDPADGTFDCEIYDIQLERKDHATPFANSSRAGVVHDCSGYGNDATLSESTTPQWVEDSKIGTGAYFFNNKSRVNSTFLHIRSTNTVYIPKQWTIAVWIKGLASEQPPHNIYPVGWQNLCFNGPTSAQTDNRSGIIYYYDASNYTSWACGGRGVYDGNWHHWAITYNGDTGELKQYIDGVLRDSTTRTNLYHLETFRYFYVGSAWSTTYGGHHGYIDDVRVYATALSADDINELYQQMASIDNKGRIYTHQIKEIYQPFPEIEQQINTGTISGILSKYEQTNCKVTLVNDHVRNDKYSYRVYRDPNLTQAANGNVMWGGVVINFANHARFTQGKKYKLTFYYKGQTTNALVIPYFAYSVGWTSYGQGLQTGATTLSHKNLIPANFNDWDNWHYAEVVFLADKIYQIGLDGNIYFCMRQLKIGWGYSNTGALGTDIRIADIRIYELDDSEPYGIASESGITAVPKICEVGLPVRYIKDYANGSTANSSSHWVEIQAFSYGKNVALNKTIVEGAINPYPAGNTIDLLLDGITTTTPYVHSNIGYVLIDLEEVYDVQMIKVWHYWGDGRTYYGTKTQVSADGVNWITVFDSAIEGTYKETADGHTIICRPQNFRINEEGAIFANRFIEG